MSISALLIRILAVILAMSCHELAHGLVSYLFGDPTARNRGRLTLNPLAHVDWMGLVCLLIFGIGWAKPVPVDSSYYKNKKTGIIWTSFAGPLANFVFAFLCILLYYLCIRLSVYSLFLLQLLGSTAVLSIGFGIFNLIPIPPLDGSKILFSFLDDEKYYRFTEGNQLTTLLFILIIATNVLSSPLSLMVNNCVEIFSNVARLILGV